MESRRFGKCGWCGRTIDVTKQASEHTRYSEYVCDVCDQFISDDAMLNYLYYAKENGWPDYDREHDRLRGTITHWDYVDKYDEWLRGLLVRS